MDQFTPEEYIKNCLGEVDKDCVKISMAITQIRDDENVVGWFLNKSGKFFFKDGELCEDNYAINFRE